MIKTPFFNSKEEFILLVDIGSGSVGMAILESQGKFSKIIYSNRMKIIGKSLIKPNKKGSRTLKKAIQTTRPQWQLVRLESWASLGVPDVLINADGKFILLELKICTQTK